MAENIAARPPMHRQPVFHGCESAGKGMAAELGQGQDSLDVFKTSVI